MPDLPPVEEAFIADTSRYAGPLEALAAVADQAAAAQERLNAAIAEMQRLMDQAAAGATGAAAAESSLAEAEQNVAAGGAAAAAGMDEATAAAVKLSAETYLANAAIDAEKEAMYAAASSALLLAGAEKALTESSNGAAAGAARAAVGFRLWGFGLALTRNALHWVVAGAAEFLAVAIPAAVALAAGLAVASAGAQAAYQHFTALYQATESTYLAFHQTVGSVLGLGSALTNAQAAAKPGVYEILGSVINDLQRRMGVFAQAGLQVVHMFDEFAARVTVDLQTGMGTQIQGLLSGMVHDLQQFGQVLGNLGHALLNFASAMPGLAHVLLTIAVGISEVVMWASRAGPLLTFGMALEEMYRWGGLVLGILVRLTGATAAMNAMGAGGFIFRFGAALATLVGVGGRVIQWAGSMIASMTLLGPAAARAGAAMETFGFDTRIAAAAMSPGMVAAAVAAVAALGFLGYKLATMQTATQKWAAASDQAVASASDLNVLPTIYSQMADTIAHATSTQVLYNKAAGEGRLAAGMQAAAVQYNSQNMGALASHMMSLIATAATVRSNISLLAGVFHISAIGALALANAAGVNLQVGLTRGSTAAKIAEQQINNLKAGLGAMAAPAGVIGADMEAIGVQSQLASSKVGQVNQALDAFVGTTTGGMTTVMQFNAALRLMGHDGAASSVSIDGAITRISASAARMGYTLTGFGARAQQSWQQFDAALQQGNAVLDTFRVGMAEGVVSAGQYNREIQAVGGALLPFAAHNRTALALVSELAQEMGNPATTNLRTLAREFGITGKAAQEMATMGMERAIARMANLSTVARNLSATVSGQLDAAMASAIVKASGLDAAYMRWATDVKANAAPATLQKDLAAITRAQDFVNTAEAKGTQLLNTNARAAAAHAAAVAADNARMADSAKRLSDQAAVADRAVGAVKAHALTMESAATAASGLSSKVADVNNKMSTASGTTQRLSAQYQQAGRQAQTAAGQVQGLHTQVDGAASAALTASGKMTQFSGSVQHAGNMAATSAGQVSGLASAIAALQSKTITITTNLVTTMSHRAAGGPVAPGVPYLVGEEGRPEIFVPSQPGTVLSGAETARIMSGAGGGPPAGSAPQVVHLTADIHTHAYVDGKEVFTSMKPEAYRWMIRNRGVADGVWVPS